MTLKHFSYLDESAHILLLQFFGSLTFSDVACFWCSVSESAMDHNELTGFVLDYRDSTFNDGVYNHDEIESVWKANITLLQKKRLALVATGFKEVAVLSMLEDCGGGIDAKVFTTVSSAVDWVSRNPQRKN